MRARRCWSSFLLQMKIVHRRRLLQFGGNREAHYVVRCQRRSPVPAAPDKRMYVHGVLRLGCTSSAGDGLSHTWEAWSLGQRAAPQWGDPSVARGNCPLHLPSDLQTMVISMQRHEKAWIQTLALLDVGWACGCGQVFFLTSQRLNSLPCEGESNNGL